MLLHVDLGGAAAHAAHRLSDVAPLLPGRKDLRGGGRNLQKNMPVRVRTSTPEVKVGSWTSVPTCFLLMMGDLTALMVETDGLLEGETGLQVTLDHKDVNMAPPPTCDVHAELLR